MIYIYNVYTRYCNYCCTEYCSTVVRIILILKKIYSTRLLSYPSFESHLLLSFISPLVVATAIQ